MKSGNISGVNYLESKQEEEYILDSQKQENQNNPNSNHWIAKDDRIVDCEVATMNVAKVERLETDVQVGSVDVPGTDGRWNDMEERSVPNISSSPTSSTKDFTPEAITNARLLVEIVNADTLKASRCRLISIVSLLLLVGIILIVVLTRRSTTDPALESAENTAENALEEKIKSLLTDKS